MWSATGAGRWQCRRRGGGVGQGRALLAAAGDAGRTAGRRPTRKMRRGRSMPRQRGPPSVSFGGTGRGRKGGGRPNTKRRVIAASAKSILSYRPPQNRMGAMREKTITAGAKRPPPGDGSAVAMPNHGCLASQSPVADSGVRLGGPLQPRSRMMDSGSRSPSKGNLSPVLRARSPSPLGFVRRILVAGIASDAEFLRQNAGDVNVRWCSTRSTSMPSGRGRIPGTRGNGRWEIAKIGVKRLIGVVARAQTWHAREAAKDASARAKKRSATLSPASRA